jgi:Holliday junction resolvasome RuvABC ATP-dependent DNA helicase subunit
MTTLAIKLTSTKLWVKIFGYTTFTFIWTQITIIFRDIRQHFGFSWTIHTYKYAELLQIQNKNIKLEKSNNIYLAG